MKKPIKLLIICFTVFMLLCCCFFAYSLTKPFMSINTTSKEKVLDDVNSELGGMTSEEEIFKYVNQNYKELEKIDFGKFYKKSNRIRNSTKLSWYEQRDKEATLVDEIKSTLSISEKISYIDIYEINDNIFYFFDIRHSSVCFLHSPDNVPFIPNNIENLKTSENQWEWEEYDGSCKYIVKKIRKNWFSYETVGLKK